ncbi:cyclic nucleotide-binding domain-containing protein (CRP Part 1) [Salmonella enterica subsp. enterica serovar Typhimurium]|uniref:Catabolite activator protein n=2 Tax=Salmonella enterica TaxID=28901 RepID=A0A7L7S5H2_SALTM|nr:hypothetical protein [Salmonella enterica subsp. enterica serovar Typhimurium]UZW43016.1 cyclic nucleotide-binding domain-containing protein (CRP Part 1) [Salmonella enterica subsp. enterica serovar Typhimurium]
MVLGKPQTDPTLEWFLSHCHIHKYPSKSTLIHQGEKAETLYYIVKGSVAVLIKDEEGKEMILSYLNQGDFIGELGLFEEGQERSALMNPLMILVKIIKLRWIHILSYDQMVSRKINNQTTRCANSIFYTTLFTNSAPNYT